MTDTVTVDPELAKNLLDDTLDRDAASHPSAEAPPMVPWLNEDGTPRWGVKADGTPRRSKPGPGAPKRSDAEKPRTTDKPASTPAKEPPKSQPAPAGPPKDYTEDIGGALTLVWMGLASVPFTRAHAAIVRGQTPAMVPAWNQAAQQNPTVRKYVEKLSGEGSWAWVIPVTIVTVPLAAGMWQVTRDRDLRQQLAAQTEKDFAEFITEQARAAGMKIPGPQSAQQPQEDPNASPGPSEGPAGPPV